MSLLLFLLPNNDLLQQFEDYVIELQCLNGRRKEKKNLLEDVAGTCLFEGISCNCDCNFVGKLKMKCFTAKIIATRK
jgi:hypothetical protein